MPTISDDPKLVREVVEATLPVFDDDSFLASRTSWLYTLVYNNCGPHTYNDIYEFAKRQLEIMAARIVNERIDDVDSMRAAFDHFYKRARLVRAVFGYADRVYSGSGTTHRASRNRRLMGVAAQAFASAAVAKLQPGRLCSGPLPLEPFDEEAARKEISGLDTEALKAELRAGGASEQLLSAWRWRLQREALSARRMRAARLLHPDILAAAVSVDQNDRREGFDLVRAFEVQVPKQQARICDTLRKWRRVTPSVGRIARFVRLLFTEAHLRPGAPGAAEAKRNFEETCVEYEGKRQKA